VRNSLVPHFDEEGRLIAYDGIIEDIIERKKIEEALQESKARYRSLFDNIQNGFALHKIILDTDNKPVDYEFLGVNKAFEMQTGLKKDDIIGKCVTEVFPGIKDDPAHWIETYGEVALTGNNISFENYSESLKKWYSVMVYCPNAYSDNIRHPVTILSGT